ncbi:hypothetical protein [Neorhizobium lilium]|uniref:hypothetical protein n=1 Tax=Neorhizobium lilium TaxID=2503024 RepID=UPI0013E40EC1|nr:hypothetical protein [Neorhizobium lilium]
MLPAVEAAQQVMLRVLTPEEAEEFLRLFRKAIGAEGEARVKEFKPATTAGQAPLPG